MLKQKKTLLFLIGIILLTSLQTCSPSRPTTTYADSQKKTIQYNSNKEQVSATLDLEPSNVEITKPKQVVLEEPEIIQLPPVEREFRAAWIATVANINWPSKRYLSVQEQKAEAIYLLDLLKDANFNAVIFQARPSADALYESSYEPWSYFLTGETGKAPYPYYDPLQFWIEESHKRGLELHVWLNPYRVHHSSGGSVNNQSMARKANDFVVKLKNGMYWFDPANPKTQDHVSNVVMEIVKKYDIDGIHFDDYFYPYASYNGGSDFPDHNSWNQYKANGGHLSRADWRRENVNLFIERIYKEIKLEKNHVKFGISPFGIWKPGFPNGVSGMSQYDELYADAKLWLNKGWVDYFTPQLYWPIDAPRQSFTSLLEWWNSENTHQRHLWPGLNTVEIKTADKPTEINRQIQIARQITPDSKGVAHWSIAGLTNNPSMIYSLKEGPYKSKALVPKTPWLQQNYLAKPVLDLKVEENTIKANWHTHQIKDVKHWLVYSRYGNSWFTEILEPFVSTKYLEKNKDGQKLNLVVVQAVDRLGNESEHTAQKIL